MTHLRVALSLFFGCRCGRWSWRCCCWRCCCRRRLCSPALCVLPLPLPIPLSRQALRREALLRHVGLFFACWLPFCSRRRSRCRSRCARRRSWRGGRRRCGRRPEDRVVFLLNSSSNVVDTAPSAPWLLEAGCKPDVICYMLDAESVSRPLHRNFPRQDTPSIRYAQLATTIRWW